MRTLLPVQSPAFRFEIWANTQALTLKIVILSPTEFGYLVLGVLFLRDESCGFCKKILHIWLFCVVICQQFGPLWLHLSLNLGHDNKSPKGEGPSCLLSFLHSLIFVFCLLILSVAISLSCSFALCPCFVWWKFRIVCYLFVNVYFFWLVLFTVRKPKPTLNWRSEGFGRRGSGHRTFSFVSPSRFTSNFSNLSNIIR